MSLDPKDPGDKHALCCPDCIRQRNRVEELEAALRNLEAWQPQTPKVQATLHPEHRQAIDAARTLLDGEEQ